ncbi:ribonuclease E, partial [Pseudomonas syringae pv. actinidiae ICMP 19096]
MGFTAAAVGGVISATAEADAHQQAERANSTTESVPAAEPVQQAAVAHAPVVEAPTVEAPVAETSAVETPAPQAPVAEQTVEVPAVEAPVADDAPVAQPAPEVEVQPAAVEAPAIAAQTELFEAPHAERVVPFTPTPVPAP